ncbi:MAG: TIR domain-containing protein [Pseudomonadota bacterium]
MWRVNQVRNSWVIVGERESAGFIDKADFETVERQGEKAIRSWIDRQLAGNINHDCIDRGADSLPPIRPIRNL